MFPRQLDLRPLLKHSSLFLFGPRQTGKTTLLRTLFPQTTFYNLNELDTFRELAAHPETIRQRLSPKETLVIIDEIQKLPALLNEVHSMMDRNPKLRFVLTGSSARTLRRGGVNLLGGRARIRHLHPLVSAELGPGALDRRLHYGSLPSVFTSAEPEEDLGAYVGAYLEQEIRAEGLVRSIETFSRFLEVAALSNCQLLNFTEIGSDAGVPPRTVREHFQLLEDTLVGHLVPAYRKALKRKPVSNAKFYFFDVGVARYLRREGLAKRGSAQWGQALEHQVCLELVAYLSYRGLRAPISFWRIYSKMEVDFLLGDRVAIEVKASAHVSEKHLAGLRALAEDIPLAARLVVSLEAHPRRTEDGIEILPVAMFFEKLWQGEWDRLLAA